MRVLGSEAMRRVDLATIKQEGISAEQLMERAAGYIAEWLINSDWGIKSACIVCGSGNNGGDGLVVARLLHLHRWTIKVILMPPAKEPSAEFVSNLEKLSTIGEVEIIHLASVSEAKEVEFQAESIILDCLFGTGLTRPLEGMAKALVERINSQSNRIVSVDLPSGLPSDQSWDKVTAIKADKTLTFQCPKPCLLWPEYVEFAGDWALVDIGLDKSALEQAKGATWIDKSFASSCYQPRIRFGHKGSFGHCLIVGGSKGKMGAAILASRAALKAGAGLATAYLPKEGSLPMHIALPEAMVIEDENKDFITDVPNLDKIDCIAAGPGLGQALETKSALLNLFKKYGDKAWVLDADALNLLADSADLRRALPEGSILTPHPGELKRLIGPYSNTQEEIAKSGDLASELKAIIIIKRAFTVVLGPNGECYYNSTGNPGMGTAGSGDTLTGIIAALRGQGYSAIDSATLGVYVHGAAGDMAANEMGMEGLIASNISDKVGKAFKQLA